MKSATQIAQALRKAIDPFVAELADDLAKIAADAIFDRLQHAREHAITKLREQLEGAIDVEERRKRSSDGQTRRARSNKAVRRRPGNAGAVERAQAHDRDSAEDRPTARATEAPQAAEPVAKKTRAKMACRSCGAVGFRADGCGRTHNVGPQSDAAAVVSAASEPAVPRPAAADQGLTSQTEPASAAIASRDRGDVLMRPAPSSIAPPYHSRRVESVRANRSSSPSSAGVAMTIVARNFERCRISRFRTEA